MSVYPHIKIQEQEDPKYLIFDVTENTVLIPVPYARPFLDFEKKDSYYKYRREDGEEYIDEALKKEDLSPKLYISAKEFKNDMSRPIHEGKGHRYCYYDNGELERSYVMAYELLKAGLNVVVKPVPFPSIEHYVENKDGNCDTFAHEATYYQIISEFIVKENGFDEFIDKNKWNIKFITSGGYLNIGPEFDSEGSYVSDQSAIGEAITKIASARGDCISLLEFGEEIVEERFMDCISGMSPKDNSYQFSTCFYPWCEMSTSVSGIVRNQELPACFAYLMAYANSVRSNANWFAASGVIRGEIPNLIGPKVEVGESLMNYLQGRPSSDRSDTYPYSGKSLNIRINPIMNAGTYGHKIWGNKVFKPTSEVLQEEYRSFLNVRVLMCDLKKQIYHASMRVTFEPNDDIVWLNFKSLANTILDKMKSGRGVRWYKWEKMIPEDKATIKARLYIQPIEAVEAFDFTVILTDDSTIVNEEGE